MTLNEFRDETLESVKSAEDEDGAKLLIETASLTLVKSGVGSQRQREFWVDLYQSLAEQEATLKKRAARQRQGLLIKEALSAEALSAIIAAARAAVADHVAR